MTPAPTAAHPAVLQITFRDLIGQRFNGYQLHQSLRARGWPSRMLVTTKQSDDPLVTDYGAVGRLLERGLYGAERMTALQGLLSPFALTFPFRSAFRGADVVHWHLVYPHFVGIPFMGWAARMKPTVWTLHDPWAMTGHCVHPLECRRWLTGCGRCPDLERSFTVWFDTTALVWKTKQIAWKGAPITLVVSTQWMKSRVEQSPLLRDFPCHVIPFGLDLGTWRTLDRAECRAKFGLSPTEKVIAFRMPVGIKNRAAKGIPWLIEALKRLETPERVTLLALEDAGQLAELGDRYRIVEPGWLTENARLVEALTAADVFVMPSLAESFGMMALESMACQTPVIGTAGTAIEDTIAPPRAGLVVPAHDAEALAAALAQLLGDADLRRTMGAAGRRIVEESFTDRSYVERHVELYESLAARRGAARR